MAAAGPPSQPWNRAAEGAATGAIPVASSSTTEAAGTEGSSKVDTGAGAAASSIQIAWMYRWNQLALPVFFWTTL